MEIYSNSSPDVIDSGSANDFATAPKVDVVETRGLLNRPFEDSHLKFSLQRESPKKQYRNPCRKIEISTIEHLQNWSDRFSVHKPRTII